MRSTAGPFAKAAAIAFGTVGVLASRMTFPSRSMTQTCVSSIETSNPAKYSMAALLFILESRYYRLSGSSRPLPVHRAVANHEVVTVWMDHDIEDGDAGHNAAAFDATLRAWLGP